MAKDIVPPDETPNSQSVLTDNFFYFFLSLRKNRIQKVVAAINDRFPEETVEQRARRLIAAQTPLSFLGGALTELPMLIPGLGQALRLMGLVGGTSVLIRMHLYLILEIALLYGKDIDDEARVPEMVSVVLGTGIAAGAPLLIKTLGVSPLWSLPAGGLTCATAAQLIGESAIRFYSQTEPAAAVIAPSPEDPPASLH
jgi:hypothetical protein